MPTCFRDSGSITINVNPKTLVANFQLITTRRDTCYGNSITYSSFLEGDNVPLQLTEDNELEFEIKGPEACSYIYNSSFEVDYGNGNKWKLIDYTCSSTSWLWIVLENK